MRILALAIVLAVAPTIAASQPSPGNRLAYLDEVDPYYPNAKFPKLITPQWIGEPGVEAVVILAIDDMRDPKRYEAFLRPILRRLKAIDGRAPVSIMTNQVDPQDPQLQRWLKEGLSLECHTIDHPCPFFKDGFAKAKATYDKCVELMNAIPNNKPVAFRMPCCDSLNTPSPRFYAEIFNKTTAGRFLSIDSSIFNVFTVKDPELPRDLVLMPDGTERFHRYLPKDRSFVNTIEDYPYPFVIGRLCWQFPCMTPSDWQAQNLHKPNNPQTGKDWQAALDCTVIKKGMMTMVFHPHGWIKNDQLVELVDFADKKYGKRVKFLNFREALERLEKHLLKEHPLRDERGDDNGIRVLDVNNDGYLDVAFGSDQGAGATKPRDGITRIWLGPESKWNEIPFPVGFYSRFHKNTGNDKPHIIGKSPNHVSFGVLSKNGFPAVYEDSGSLSPDRESSSFWQFNGKNWVESPAFLRVDAPSLTASEIPKPFVHRCVVKMCDLDGDGRCELLLQLVDRRAILQWSDDKQCWIALPFLLPSSLDLLPHERLHGNSVHFTDLDGDGKLDIIFSNEREYGVYLFKDMKEGWSRKVIAGKAGEPGALPMIANKGENLGFFVHSGQLWWSNETTALLKDHVARVSIQELLTRANGGR